MWSKATKFFLIYLVGEFKDNDVQVNGLNVGSCWLFSFLFTLMPVMSGISFHDFSKILDSYFPIS